MDIFTKNGLRFLLVTFAVSFLLGACSAIVGLVWAVNNVAQ